jgi:integrase/recombinase XerD
MSALARQLDDYLRLRRMLGHKLDDAARQLPWFVEHLNATKTST